MVWTPLFAGGGIYEPPPPSKGNAMRITRVGLDLAKYVFEVHGVAAWLGLVSKQRSSAGVWTGTADVLAPLRWKRAKTHRGSRHRHMPHQEAGYTSAVVALDPQHAEHLCNRAGSIYVHTWHFSDGPDACHRVRFQS